MTQEGIPTEWATIARKVAGFDQIKVRLEAIEKVCRTRKLGFGNQYFRLIEDMAKEGLDQANKIGGVS